jgi:3-deoxy-D-manno-octulosonic-acid transferase
MVDLFNMRGERDARRLLSLGAPRDRVFVQGNIKFDSLPPPGPPPESLERFRRESGWSETDPVIVGGSTFKGEEAILLDAYDRLKDDYPGLKLILAPRHIERVGEVEDLVRSRGKSYRLFSSPPPGPGTGIVIVDRIGLLSEIYLLGAVVFVGRSLMGKGGQNPIEPAALGKPIIFGPFMDNFREIADELVRAEGAIVVRDAYSLETALRALLSRPEEAERMGNQAREVVEKRRGASQRNLDEIKRLLERS